MPGLVSCNLTADLRQGKKFFFGDVRLRHKLTGGPSQSEESRTKRRSIVRELARPTFKLPGGYFLTSPPASTPESAISTLNATLLVKLAFAGSVCRPLVPSKFRRLDESYKLGGRPNDLDRRTILESADTVVATSFLPTEWRCCTLYSCHLCH